MGSNNSRLGGVGGHLCRGQVRQIRRGHVLRRHRPGVASAGLPGGFPGMDPWDMVYTLEDERLEPTAITPLEGKWSEPNLQGIMFQLLIFRGVFIESPKTSYHG